MPSFDLLHVDGSQGEGGGQVLRTSLALSMVTGRSFRITGIRAGRAKPGLLRQHLTALRAAAEITRAEVTGDALGSSEVTFRPKAVRAGAYHFAVGTAGSATLVLQTVLPALMLADAPSQVTVEGGTHNPAAPPFDFLERTFVPQLAKLGPQMCLALVRPGFYPAGGGRIEAEIQPVPRYGLGVLNLTERGEITSRRFFAHGAALPWSILEREVAHARVRLPSWPAECFAGKELPEAHGPGNVVFAEVTTPEITEVFTGFGARGVSAEKVVDGMANETRAWLASSAPVGEHLADQLLLPMALAGRGSFRATALSSHARTNMDVIRHFLDVSFAVETSLDGSALVRVEAT